MWMDSDGVTHSVALSDPSTAMGPETVASLNALSDDERSRVLKALDNYESDEAVWREIMASALGPEGEPLPHGFLTQTIRNADEALAVVNSAEPAWRIDVLLAIQDYLERDE